MSDEKQNDLDAVREEHLKQVYELYQDKAKYFRKIFSGLCIFALAYLFIILIPYISIKVRSDEIPGQVQRLSEQIAQSGTRIEAYESAIIGYQEVRTKLENSPNDLRDFILGLDRSPQGSVPSFQQQSQSTQGGACDSFVDAERTTCLVNQEVERIFMECRDSLQQTIIVQLRSLDEEAAASIDIAELESGLDELQTVFEAKLDVKPDFWLTFTGKETFFAELRAEVDRFWQEKGSAIETQYAKLEKELAALEENRTNLETEYTQLKADEDRISKRFQEIEFPFGSLPIGLAESVAVFPILIAIGFGVVVSVLLETIRLRRVFQTLYQQKDSDKIILTDEQISLIAPLWIDPADPRQNRVVQLGVLSLPLLVFVVAGVLVSFIWTTSEGVNTILLDQWLFGGLYLVGLGIFIYAYWQLATQLRRYSVSA
ncbi:MAG: hypothetical protein C0393_00915 [Anaerolinea sp.]|nr:hypothetical protein [Anaerolinea sp.]